MQPLDLSIPPPKKAIPPARERFLVGYSDEEMLDMDIKS
jgi:hypothetical protein